MRRVMFLAQLALVAGMTLFAPGAAQGQTSYSIQRIFQPGDPIGDIATVKGDRYFGVGTLNDSGRLVFSVWHDPGGQVLVQYANGKLTPLVAAGQDAPVSGGKWPSPLFFTEPVSMNQLGNIVFAVGVAEKADTFLWDAKTQQVVPVALKGMPAANNLTFETGGEYTPAINNSNEIAFPARIRNGAGEIRSAVFSLGRDGKTLPVALPDQALPDGGKIGDAFVTSINDAGVIGLVVARQGEQVHSGYVWEKGIVTPVGTVGTQAPGGGEIADVRAVQVNNKNASALVWAQLLGRKTALYRSEGGKLTPVAAPGQTMPDGGTLSGMLKGPGSTSYASTAGEHAFLASLSDRATAAYRMDAEGKLSLILKSGATTDLGTILRVGGGEGTFGISLNARGQVALPISLVGGTEMVVLLTPTAP